MIQSKRQIVFGNLSGPRKGIWIQNGLNLALQASYLVRVPEKKTMDNFEKDRILPKNNDAHQ
jgi:hypothetical protein